MFQRHLKVGHGDGDEVRNQQTLEEGAASGPKILVIGCCKNLTVTSPEIMGRIGWASCQTEQGWAEWYGHVRPKFDQKNMSRKSLL